MKKFSEERKDSILTIIMWIFSPVILIFLIILTIIIGFMGPKHYYINGFKLIDD